MEGLDQLFGLKGKVALVTGASSGLGVEFAHALAQAGADVAIMARRRERLEALVPEIEAHGVRCLPVPADVTVDAELTAGVDRVVSELGGLDVLVNNAGAAPFGRSEKLSREQWDSVLEVNLSAVFRLCQLAALHMIERGQGGRIINISSVLGNVGNAIYPTVGYCASKGGVELMTRHLAVEWARHGITVNAIAPGWFPTEMNVDPKHGDIHPKYKERMLERIPLNRLGDPKEIRGTVVYLASPAGAYVTGTTVAVDGGWLAW